MRNDFKSQPGLVSFSVASVRLSRPLHKFEKWLIAYGQLKGVFFIRQIPFHLLVSCAGGDNLANLSEIVKQLNKERDRLHHQLSGLNAALEAFAGVYRGHNGLRPRRKISAKGRASIAAAQRARWAKVKRQIVVPIAKTKRTMSASARRRIAAAQKARWAKVRANKAA